MHISYCSRTDPGSDRPPQIVVHYLHDDGSIEKVYIKLLQLHVGNSYEELIGVENLQSPYAY